MWVRVPPSPKKKKGVIMNEATLRLFNAIQVDEKAEISKVMPVINASQTAFQLFEKDLQKTIQLGFILHPSIKATDELIQQVESIVGISGEKANAAFHKSWMTVHSSSAIKLFAQQAIHYLTVYGFERLGIYKENRVYIPKEKLEIPEFYPSDDIPLVVIKAMTREKILEAIIAFAETGIAMSQQSLDDIMTIVVANEYSSAFVKRIKNKELKSLLSKHYNIVPSHPQEFLRYMVTELTGRSLLIKDKETIEALRDSDSNEINSLIEKAPKNFASIFLRYKPLFLALKKASKNKNYFNRLRKQAKYMHRPMKKDYLNNVTAYIKHNMFHHKNLEHHISSASIFRKARLLYALRYRMEPQESIVYRIRNGKGWATEFNYSPQVNMPTEHAYSIVYNSIVDQLRPAVEGKIIFIPKNVNYVLPATEKQFTGNFPTGSYISVPEHMVVGIHWTNTDNRVDMDLSTIDGHGKIGWDAAYRSKDRKVLFSGDITDAPKPKGASELFYIKEASDPKILNVNYFNFRQGDTCDIKLFVGSEEVAKFGGNYMVNPNNIIASTLLEINRKQNTLGLIATAPDGIRFYFGNVYIGNSATARYSFTTGHIRKYLCNMFINSVGLKEILIEAGAMIAYEKPDKDYDYIDLCPNAIDKMSIINLLTNEK